MKNFTRLFLLIVPMAIFAGCKKEKADVVSVAPIDAINDFKQMNAANATGYIVFHSYQSLASQCCPDNSTQINGWYLKTKFKKVCLGPVVYANNKIGYKEMPCENVNLHLNGVNPWGQVVTLTADLKTFGNTYAKDFYVPQKLRISSPVFQEDATINAGATIQWNVDDTNPKEDIIELRYDPNGYGNESKGGESITKQKSAGHSGSYTITAADLADFPEGGYISILIKRYNYITFTNPYLKEDFRIIATSLVSAGFRVEK